ncbi:hypothetical protein ABZP36_001482 [Zizania latifolia]
MAGEITPSGSRRSWLSSGAASISRSLGDREDPFRRSVAASRHDEGDDEENLRWAALEKLPTYDRMRRGIIRKALEGEGGKGYTPDEVDIANLDPRDGRELMERVFKAVEDDNERFLRRFRDRLDQVGIELPQIEVRYEHLDIEADVYVGKRALPTLLNATINSLEGLISRFIPSANKRTINILKDVNGILKPSRMTLLLGPPSSGKSTLMRALTGKPDKNLKVSGEITYCGHTFSEFYPERTSAYVSQYDLHNPEMTVRETLDFSRQCLGVGARYDMLSELARRERNAGIKPDPEIDAFMKATAVEGKQNNIVTDLILKVLGLDICADIIVGGAMIRGISGGQKKRVTTEKLPVFYKQRDYLFFPAWTYGIANIILKVPLSLMESSIWIILTYYVIGFAPAAERFFKQFLAYFCTHQMALALFRFLGAILRSMVVANTFGMFVLLLVFLFGGFLIARKDIKPWWIWAYWTSPMMYSNNALSVNEFLASRWAIPNNDTSIDAPTIGKAFLKSKGYFTGEWGYWLSIGAMIGFMIIFNILYLCALTFLNNIGGSNAVVSDDDTKNESGTESTNQEQMSEVTNAEARMNIDFAEVYANSALYRSNQELIKQLSVPPPGNQDLSFPTKYSQNFLNQCVANTWKQFRSYWKDPPYNVMRYFMTLLYGLVFGTVFLRKAKNVESVTDLQSLLGATYAAVFFLGAANLITIMPVVSIERTVFYREKAAGMYSPLAYAFAQVFVEFCYGAVQGVLYTILIYPMVGYEWKADKFFYFLFFMIAAFTYFTLFSMMLVACTPNEMLANVLLSFVLSQWNNFAGFIIARPMMPVWWRWFYWANPVSWTIYGVIGSQFSDITRNVTVPGQSTTVVVKDFLKDNMGYKHDFLGYVVLGHFAYIIVFFFLFGYGIKYLNFQKR